MSDKTKTQIKQKKKKKKKFKNNREEKRNERKMKGQDKGEVMGSVKMQLVCGWNTWNSNVLGPLQYGQTGILEGLIRCSALTHNGVAWDS